MVQGSECLQHVLSYTCPACAAWHAMPGDKHEAHPGR